VYKLALADSLRIFDNYMVKVFEGCIKLSVEAFDFVVNSRQFKELAIGITHDLIHKDPLSKITRQAAGFTAFQSVELSR